MASLFRTDAPAAPLAERVRPRKWEDLLGLELVSGPETPFGRQVAADALASTVLWGPPGSGKTTLARLIAGGTRRPFVGLSAVLSSLKEVREVMEKARTGWRGDGRPTILFMDEIHRFNKAQQDAFLPYLEEGSVVLLGTTTENPSFHLTPALLSRCRVLILPGLGEEQILKILRRAMAEDPELKAAGREVPDPVLEDLARLAAADARFALNALEALVLRYPEGRGMSPPEVRAWLSSGRVVYDWGGEEHYNLISAYHKSIRNSDVQAALYWLLRMLEGGEDPLFVARRLVRAASEDVGNADPQALRRALDAKEAVDFLGMPEGALALVQATAYLCAAPKSNRAYLAQKAVERDLRAGRRHPVPLALRNAPTRLMEEAGYGEGYAYAHDEPLGIADLECLPPELVGREYYEPSAAGFEARIAEWMALWKKRRAEARSANRRREKA
ncbi:MAG: replication-associated recombination protein A [Acidobacteriota bacterium]